MKNIRKSKKHSNMATKKVAVNIGLDELGSIKALVDYLHDDEEASYEAAEPGSMKGHIFNDVVKVAAFLDNIGYKDARALAINDLRVADKMIKKRTKYQCGIVIVSEREAHDWSIGDYFFSSPDGQNEELFIQLRAMGYKKRYHHAEYDWSVVKNGVTIQYCEGDIYVREL